MLNKGAKIRKNRFSYILL